MGIQAAALRDKAVSVIKCHVDPGGYDMALSGRRNAQVCHRSDCVMINGARDPEGYGVVMDRPLHGREYKSKDGVLRAFACLRSMCMTFTGVATCNNMDDTFASVTLPSGVTPGCLRTVGAALKHYNVGPEVN